MNPGEALNERAATAPPDDIWRAYRKVLHLQRGIPEIRLLPRTGGAFPLSPVQQRLWILHQLDPASPHYNVARAFEIAGPLDVTALERSLAGIVRRHETLRTGFHLTPEGPVQVPEPGLASRLVQVDLSGLAPGAREGELAAALRALGHQTFELARPPLFRPALVRLAPERSVLLLVLHHIVFDGASLRIFWRELASLYSAFAAGGNAVLPDLPVQYVDFARWQRDLFDGGVLAEQLAIWKRELAGAPSVLDLAGDRPRPPVESHRGATLAFSLPRPLAAGLQALGRREGATFFMVLLAGLAALLYRTTGQTDIPIGTPTANRSRREIRGLIGFFVNTLVLRVRPRGGLSAAGLLREVREVVTTAFSAPDLPLDRLVDELGVERSSGYNPLFQVMFVLQSSALAGLGLPGLRVTPHLFDSEAAMFDLALEMEEGEAGVAALLEYATDLFDRPTAQRLTTHLEILLAGAAAEPERSLEDLPLLTAAERQAVLVEWSDAGRGAAESLPTVCELFLAQAGRSPEAVAVRGASGEATTYGELARRVVRLAGRLARAGVGPEVPVGICLRRSPELIAALLAVHAAGGAYVPVDPSYPSERRSLILERAGVALVLADAGAAGELAGLGVPVLALGTEEAGAEAVPAPADPQGLAYVLFTSGSTGEPKGVAISQCSLAAYVTQAVLELGLGPGDRVLQFASIGFDTAAEEIFPCLAAGATLVLRPDAMIDSVPAFLESCAVLGITVLDLPTAYWHEWVSWRAARTMRLWPELRLVILGGESLLPGRVAEWYRRAEREVRLLNTYGPTEATIVATLQDLSGGAGERPGVRTVSIGRPLPGVRTWVLDTALQPVPPGSPGELCLGGIGLARGYVRDGGATAAQFVPDPCSEEPGARLYRTGDRVRHLPDGSLDFLGRIDGQVKIRGIRVELGEIEAALAACPALAGCAVALDTGGGGLTAFVVPRPEHPAEPAALRAFLAERLPETWLPGAFVLLEALPLSSHGKVDRRALAKLAASAGPRTDSSAAPRTPLERVLAGIWEEVTRRGRIGVEDNFFAIGGHSLLGSQILSRLYDGFQVRFPLRGLFDAPTVAGLAAALRRDFDPRHRLEARCRLLLAVRELPDAEVAAWLERRSQAGAAPALADAFGLDPARAALLGRLLEEEGIAPPALPRIPRHDWRPGAPLPLSFAQERLWFFEQLEPGSPAYVLAAGFVLRGPLDCDALERALEAVVERHGVLRSSFPVERGQPAQTISPVVLPMLARTDLTALPEEHRETEARRLATGLAGQPFDIARRPLFRFSLLRLGRDLHWLVLSFHHIAFDGWSLDLLLRELSEGYAAASSGRTPRLPELPVQYADFALWQRDWLEGPEAQEQLAYWRERLAGISGCTLPSDRPRPPVQTTCGAVAALAIPPAVAGALRALGRREGTSLFMTLLAIFAVLLGRHSGQEDVVVGTPVAGRNSSDVERLVGLFLNTLALRLDLSGNPSFAALLGRVREAVLADMARQDLPFEKLVKELKPERDLARTPLFQVLFNMLSLQGRPLALPGIAAEPLPSLTAEAKFDLTLYAEEPATGEIDLLLVYNADLYDAPRMADLLAQLGQLAAAVAENPKREIDRLSLRTPAAAALLPDPAQPLPAVPWERGIPGRFAAWARRAPGRTAVVDAAGSLDYGTLDAQSRRLARQLRAGGVGPEEIVAVYAHRSSSLVVALLGILRAGAAFLILDPAYPPALLAQRLRLGRPKAWIEREGTELSAEIAACLAEVDGPPLRLCLSDPGPEEEVAEDGPDDPDVEVRPDGLAYLAFTSGTTGVPKGILGTHRPLDAFLGWHARTFGLGEADRFSALSGLAHDPLLRDLFTPLSVGGSVHLPDPGRMGLPGWLAAWMAESAITVSHLTPAMAEVLLEGCPPGTSLPEVRFLFFGGDLLDRQIVERMRRLAPRACAVNFYGATETPQGVAFHSVEDDIPSGMVPVGRGIDGVQLLVLGPGGVPAGIGELGEISVRSACLARGYLDGQEGERFRANPWTGDPADRLYRTGDLGRYLPDGTVAHLGRTDDQVKIRGYRIEPRAIEAALESHPDVARAAVLPRSDGRGGRELVAFVVPQAAEPEGGALRRYLAIRLAPYALPAAYAVLPTLPLTPNGKIDRSALASLACAMQPPRKEGGAPMDDLGRRLARIWQLLLGSPVGLEDNFFDIGGHSLLAVRLLAEIERELDVKLPVTSLFQAQTIQDLAMTLREALAQTGKDLRSP